MGEANNRQSSSIGDGVWGTTDGGEHWTHLGLDDTQSIARIVVDPDESRTSCTSRRWATCSARIPTAACISPPTAARTGRRRSSSTTTPASPTSRSIPSNPKILYAASYQRQRTWWGYNGGGPGSGLWKSTDGGETWTRLEGPGWPKAEGRHLRPHRDLDLPRQALHHLRPGRSRRERRHGQRHWRGWRPGARRTRRRGRRIGRGGIGCARRRRASGGAAAAGNAAARPSGRRRRRRRWTRRRPRPASRSQRERRVPLRRRRQDLDVHEQSEPAPDVLQPDPRGPGQRPEDLRRRQPGPDVHSTAARPGPASPARTPITTPSGSIRRIRAIVFVGHDGGLDVSNDGGLTWDYPQRHRGRPVLSGLGRHAPSLLRLRRPAGQQRLVRPERAALHHRPGEYRLVHGGGRRRLLHPPGPDRLGDRLRRIAGRQHEPPRHARRHAEEHPAQRRRRPRRPGGGRPRPRRARNRAPNVPPPGTTPPPANSGDAGRGGRGGGGGGGRGGPPNVVNAPPNVEPSASTGTRRSRSRRTIRRWSTWPASTSSSPTTAATRGG